MSKRKPYHHGNLREELLQAGLNLIAEAGLAGFTLREAARRAGVSHNAPYRHFRDKEELLAALAGQGFTELTQAMADAAGNASNSMDRLRRAGLAYVEFALRRPQHFTVMFDAAVGDAASLSGQAGAQAFQALVRLIEDGQRDGQLPAGDPVLLARVAWSLVHGIAKLAVARRFPGWNESQVLEFANFAMTEAFPGMNPA
ncbi:MAG TPA: TetR/AcrR family transcriptional regulator [Bryobacteraceae bacterium]|nr:TetR/AcrR family transcriptional regulator [Bryobacteraceae bacterium]